MLTYGFFNSVSGDRTYNADTISNMFKGLISDGVYQSVGDAFAVTAGSGMAINVGSGRAIVDDRWAENDADITLEISAANAVMARWTAVVLRKDLSARTVSLVTIDGTAAASPVRPQIVRSGSVYDILLAYIYVGAAVTSISNANITDMRSNTSVCGWVTGLVDQLDTETLFTQFAAAYQENLDDMEAWEAAQKAAFDEWYAALTSELNVNTYVRAYEGNVVTTSDGQSVLDLPFTAEEYAAGDVLEVYANGIRLVPEAFSADPAEMKVTLAAEAPRGQLYHFVVLKSKIGQAV